MRRAPWDRIGSFSKARSWSWTPATSWMICKSFCPRQNHCRRPLSEEERRVYDAIDTSETPIDDIAAKAALPSAVVSSTLLQLELKRLVKQLPGKYFVKLG